MTYLRSPRKTHSHLFQTAKPCLALLAGLALLPGCAMLGGKSSGPAARQLSAEPRTKEAGVDDARGASRADLERLPLVQSSPTHLVALASYSQDELPDSPEESTPTDFPSAEPLPLANAGALLPAASLSSEDENVYPIDLANALGMAGGSHLQIRLARERAVEAQANLLAAKATWLPSLRAGLGWNKHDGRIQQTQGDILEVSRNSLFLGGGAGLGNAPLTGGSGGPFRMAVDLSIADAVFEPRVAQCMLAARRAGINRTFNDSLLQVATAYFDLLEAHGLVANANVGVAATKDMVRLTTVFADQGLLAQAEVDRARNAADLQATAVQEAERLASERSAELVRLVRLDPQFRLVPVEERIAPIEVIDASLPLSELIGQGLASRPELYENQALINARSQNVAQEHWRPWLPNVHVGGSAGSFGGGPGSTYENESNRSDIDVLAVWELQNAGYGNRALRQMRCSQYRQATIQAAWARDMIQAQVAKAAGDVRRYRQQMQTTMQAAKSAQQSYRLNRQRVEQGEGLPLELLQAIRSLALSLDAYTASVADYNRAQFRLLRAVGEVPAAPAPAATSGSSPAEETTHEPEEIRPPTPESIREPAALPPWPDPPTIEPAFESNSA